MVINLNLIQKLNSSIVQWRTQKLFTKGTDEMFNHIFKGCSRVFSYNIHYFFHRVRSPTLAKG
ncbi:hypothetical protein Hanom_Chr04g00326681 [Helianthus anomalus]